jgi:hypothetical protein
MKMLKNVLNSGKVTLALLAMCLVVQAQESPKSPKASVYQRIGIETDALIDYSRPGVKGRTIWGDLVPYGMNEGNKYSKGKPYPWRAGANENTTITLSKDVLIEGEKLPAGKYSIHMLPGEKEFQVMFNKVSDAWGSYTYDASQNVLEITVKPAVAEHTEWLEFEFADITGSNAVVQLKWAELAVPFEIEVVN